MFVSHDRYFIDKLATEIWDIQGGGLKRYDGGWTSFAKAREEGRALPDPPGAVPLSAAAGPERRPIAGAAGSPAAPAGDRSRRGRVPLRRQADRSSNDRTTGGSRRTASRVRKVEGVRALEARIAAMELQLTQLAKRLEDVAAQGNYLETRQLGAEHADLEQSLKALYEEWTSANEQPTGEP